MSLLTTMLTPLNFASVSFGQITVEMSATMGTLNVSSTATLGILDVSSTASIGTLDVSATATVGNLIVSATASFPNQSFFRAYATGSYTNVTGDATAYIVIFNTESIDRNGDYNNATGIYIAPADGIYLFGASIGLDDIVAHTQTDGRIVTSNDSYLLYLLDAEGIDAPGDRIVLGGSRLVEMDAGDTANISVTVTGAGKSVDIINSNLFTHFTGGRMY